MNPSDNSLENVYNPSDYSSSLETPSPSMQQNAPTSISPPPDKSKFKQSIFKYDRKAFVVTCISIVSIGLIASILLLLSNFHNSKQNSSLTSQQVNSSYAVGSTLSLQNVSSTGQLQVTEANQLTVNGTLNVNKSLILAPGTAPTSPVAGQIYFNQVDNTPYYYNGNQFVSLSAGVNNIGGSTGAIILGNGLSVNGNTLSVSSSIIQQATAGTSKVSSLQGLTSTISLSAGSGISVNGTTISNNGVVRLTSQDGSVIISPNGDGSYDLSAVAAANPVISIGGVSGTILLGNGLNVSGHTLNLPQPLSVTDSPTFAGLTLTGGSNGNLIIQSVNTSTSGNVTIGFPTDLNGGTTDTICLKNDNNCGSSTKAVTYSGTGGTINTIPIFDSAGMIGNSGITDNGSTVGITDATAIQGSGSLNITSGGNLSVGSSGQPLSLIGSASASTFLKVYSGAYFSELNFANVTANQIISLPNNSGLNGTICLEQSPSCGFASASTGVTSLNTLSGNVNIADVQSASGGVITIQNASTSVPGLVQIDSDNNLVFNSGLLDTAQSIKVTSSPTFENLTLNGSSGNNGTLSVDTIENNSTSSNLTINGGNGGLAIISDGITFSFPTSGSSGQTICTTGVSCASGGGEAVILGPSGVQTDTSTLDGINILKNSNSGNIFNLQVQNSSTSNIAQNALLIDNNGNTTLGYGSSSTVTAQNLTLNNALNTNNIVPKTGGNLAIGSSLSQFTLQGNSNSYITSNNGSGANTRLVFDYGSLSGNSSPSAGTVTYYLPNDSTVATNSAYEICTTLGNCSGTGGSLTGSGTVDDVAYFSTSNNLVSTSLITFNPGASTTNFNGSIVIQGSNALQLGTTGTNNGGIVFNNSTNSNTVTLTSGATASALTLLLPTSGGMAGQCLTTSGGASAALSFENCVTGGSGGGSVSAVNTLTGSVNGPALSGSVYIADATSNSATGTITIQNASATVPGLVQINSDNNLVFNSGLLDTAQSITTSAVPTFAGLTIQGSSALTVGGGGYNGSLVFGEASNGFTDIFNQNTLSGNQQINIPYNSSCTTSSPCTLPVTVANGGNLSISATGALNTISSPTFSGLVTAGSFSGVGSSLTSLSGGNITNSSVPDTALVHSSITINNGTNISGGNTVSLGGALTIATVNNPVFSGGVTTGSVDNSGALSIGTTNATSLTIGSSSFQASFPGGITSAAAIQGLSFDTASAGGLTIGGNNATSITLGKSGVGTTIASGLTTQGISANGSITIADGNNLTINSAGGSGALGQLADYYESTISGYGQYLNTVNLNYSSTASSVYGENIVLQGTNNSNANANTTDGIYFANVAAATNNTFNALYLGTGFNNAIQSAGALNLTGAAASTWDIGNNTLSLQTTNNGAITTGTGLLTVKGAFVATTTNSPTAFQVENSGGKSVLSVDTNNSQAILGNSSNLNGTLEFLNSTNGNGITLQSGATSTSYALTLPANAPNAGLCLQTSGAIASQLIFGSCANNNQSISEVAEWDNHGVNTTSTNDSPVNIGDIIVLTTVIPTTSDSVSSVTGGGVTTWTKVVAQNGNATVGRTELWIGKVTSTGASTISVTYASNPGTNEIAATEFTATGVSANTTWGVNASGSQQNTTSSNNIAYPSLTSLGPTELYLGYGASQHAGSAGSTSGFSYIVTGGNNVITYNSPTVSGFAYTPTATEATSGQSNTVAAILTAFISSTAINNSTSLQLANFNVQATTSGSVAGVLQAASSGIGDILDLKSGAGTTIDAFSSTGNLGIGVASPSYNLDVQGSTGLRVLTTTNSQTAFQVQSSTANVLTVDTSNSQLLLRGINSIAGSSALSLSGNCANGTYWTLSGGTYSNVSGNSTPLSCTLSTSTIVGDLYEVIYSANTSMANTDSITTNIGGVNTSSSYGQVFAEKVVAMATSASTNLTFTLNNSSSVGGISSISVYQITPSNPVLTIQNSDASIGLQVRSGGSGLNNDFIGVNSGIADTTGHDNISQGYSALSSNITGFGNIANGSFALQSNTIGQYDTATGYASAQYLTNNNGSGSNDVAYGAFTLQNTQLGNQTAVGTYALQNNTTGGTNSAVGYESLQSDTSGYGNTAVGYLSSQANSSGFRNTSEGSQALENNISGNYDTAVGFDALQNTTSSNNSALGDYALQFDTTGNGLTGLGGYALQNNTTGSSSTAIGYSSLQNNTTGNYNVALGNQGLSANTAGVDNTAVGYGSLNNASSAVSAFGTITGGTGYTSGVYNNVSLTSAGGTAPLVANEPVANITVSGGSVTAVTLVSGGLGVDLTSIFTAPAASLGGTGSGFQITVATITNDNYNTSIGYNSQLDLTTGSGNTTLGYQSDYLNTTGSFTTAIGYNAGYSNASGSYDAFLGYNAGKADSGGYFATSSALQNATAIGAYAQVQENNALVLGSVDNSTLVGVGVTVPLNTFSVSPLDYKVGNASQTSGSYNITGSGTTWTSSMVGDELIWADGSEETITGYFASNQLTGSSSSLNESASKYRLHHIGLQVTSAGSVGIGTASPLYPLDVVGNINTSGKYLISGSQISSTNLSDSANIAKLNASQTFTNTNTFIANSSTALQVEQTLTNPVFTVNTTGIGNTITDNGNLAVTGTSSSYIMGSLGLGVTNPQGALTIANSAWITGVNAANSGDINLLELNSNNDLQLGTSLSVDGGIILPTDGGQLTFSDLPIDGTPTSGTPESYTLRVATSNVLTVYGESNGSGSLQNPRVAIGSSITPAYTLDVGGDINTSTQYRIGGNVICTASGCTLASGSTSYVQNQNAGAQASSNFWISGAGQAATLQGNTTVLTPTLDSISGSLNVGTTTATSVNIGNTTNTTTTSLNDTTSLNLGNNANNKTINIGTTGTTANTTALNLATSNGAAQTIDIGGTSSSGGSNSGTTVTTQGGATVLSVANAGSTVKTLTNSTTGFQVQNAGGTSELTVDTNNNLIKINAATDLIGGIQGGAVISGLSTPAAPTISTVAGGSSSTTWKYEVAAVAANGSTTAASAAGTISTSDWATITGTDYNTITWSAVIGAVSYNIYRTTASGTPSSTGYVGNTTSTTFNDTGIAATTAAPTVDSSGQLTVNGFGLFKNTTNSPTAFQIQNAIGTSLLTVDTSGSNITVAGTTSAYATLVITNAHFESTQTTAPTIGTPASCGTSPSSAVISSSTDSAGAFTITGGSSTTGVCTTTINFNQAYTSIPKAVLLTTTTAVGGATGIMSAQVTSTSTNGFTVQLTGNDIAGTVYGFYYWIIE